MIQHKTISKPIGSRLLKTLYEYYCQSNTQITRTQTTIYKSLRKSRKNKQALVNAKNSETSIKNTKQQTNTMF